MSITQEEIAENRRKWIEALRSGEYPQATGRLRRELNDNGDVGYCCLGVACEALGLERYTASSEVGAYLDKDGTPHGGDLPVLAAELLGFRHSSPVFRRAGSQWDVESLITANDSLGWSFDKIADVIESQPITWDGTSQTSVPVER